MPVKKSFDILSEKNHHERDDAIDFDADTHTYHVRDSDNNWVSVSSLISYFHPHFEAKEVVKKLIEGKRYNEGSHPLSGKTEDEILHHWELENKRGTALHARLEYAMNQGMDSWIRFPSDTKCITRKDITFIHEDGFALDTDMHSSLHDIHITWKLFEDTPVYIHGDAKKVYIDFFDKRDVKQKTKPLHVNIQTLHLGYIWSDSSYRRNPEHETELGVDEPILGFEEAVCESLQMYYFWKKYQDLTPYRSEWCIWDDKHKIAGTIDSVFYRKRDNTYWIYDWKRIQSNLSVDLEATRYGYKPKSDEWLEEMKPWDKKMMYPLCEMYDKKYWHYVIQLNLYKYVIEQNYGIKISGMVIVQFHPQLTSFNCHYVVNVPHIIEKLLQFRMKYKDIWADRDTFMKIVKEENDKYIETLKKKKQTKTKNNQPTLTNNIRNYVKKTSEKCLIVD